MQTVNFYPVKTNKTITLNNLFQDHEQIIFANS
jgi:hypothetical protein